MNTQAHAIIGLALLARRANPLTQIVVAIGAVLPDVPMIVFYLIEKVFRKTPESIIWSQAYFRHGWQNFFDTFNSLPLITMLALFAWYRKAKLWMAFFLAMAVHVIVDFPLHHDDAHRHFFPFSQFRFASPVSYWDPNHYGHIAGFLEFTLVCLCTVYLWRASAHVGTKWLVGVIFSSYLVFFVFAFAMWG